MPEPRKASPAMYESWDGPPTNDPIVLRKRRLFLLALIVTFAGILLGFKWLGATTVQAVWILLAIALPFLVIEVIIQVRRRKQPR